MSISGPASSIAKAKPEGRHRACYAYPATIGICLLATLAAWLLRGLFEATDVILLYVLAVALTAAAWGRGPAVLASCAGVLCFNFFFVPPLFSLTVNDAHYLLTFTVMLAVSLIVSYLSDAYRAKAIEAERRVAETTLLHDLARALSPALSVDQVAALTDAFVRQHFGTEASLFVAGPDEHLLKIGGTTANLVEQMAAQGVYANGDITGPVAGLHDGVAILLLPLVGATRRRGVLSIQLAPDSERPDDGLAASIAALVATAVERIHYVDVARQVELEAASMRLRSSILSAISHDIRTPLTVLFGLADQLATGDADPETATALRDQAYRLHRMVDNLLDMARLKSGRVSLRRDWQSLPELVAASAKAIAPALAAHPLRPEWADDVPLLRVDPLLMERVFCNLLENAAKYSPAGSVIRLKASWDADSVRVDIDNGGAGFPLERIDRVFDLFERGDAESAIPGMGMGLSICRTIVEAHGGGIEAMNLPDGARVRITLPRETQPVMPEEIEVSRA